MEHASGDLEPLQHDDEQQNRGLALPVQQSKEKGYHKHTQGRQLRIRRERTERHHADDGGPPE
jgi:hypothetical protein